MLLYSTFSGISLASFGNFYASMNKAVGASNRIWTILDEPQLSGSIFFEPLQFRALKFLGFG